MAAGRRNRRIAFSARQNVSDGYGNEQGGFIEMFVRWAQITPSLGIETTNAARLSGQQPVDITILRDGETIEIDADWQAVDANDGTIYAITSPPIDLKQNGAELTMKAVAGRAA